MSLEYIWLAPEFVREVLDACGAWEGRGAMPLKLQELMMVLKIEADARRRKNPRRTTGHNFAKLNHRRIFDGLDNIT